MNINAHTVAPEEVMALLDGELSASESRAVSAHIEQCADCTRVATQLRKTSEELMAWPVPTPASTWEGFLLRAARIDSGRKAGKTKNFNRPGLWNWKQWTIASGAVVVALLLVLAISFPKMYSTMTQGKQQARTNGTASNAIDTLLINGQPITDQQSKAFYNPLPTQLAPDIVADSNGLYHGLGDHVESLLQGAPVPPPPPAAPMIARTVSLVVVVKDFAASRSSLDAILARHHGYSGQLNVSTPENAPRSLQSSLRIPVVELSSAVADLKTLGRVENESQSGEEVTQQHTDLVARLKNSRDTEQRFRTILQQRTGNVSEVLQVEEGIARVRGDIERMEAEQKALEHRVDFATVELQLTEEYKAQLNSPAASISTRVRNAVVAGIRNAWETVLGIVLVVAEYGPALSIWLGILALPAVLMWRRYKKNLAAV